MSNLEKNIEDYIKKLMYFQDIPGLSIVINDKNNIIYSKGFGFTNIETKEPVTEKSIFHMASITKLFVATAVMQLVEKGKIQLEDTITHYMPNFFMQDIRYKDITILQLLSHTSGMPDCLDYGWEQPEYDKDALSRYVYSLENLQLLHHPGYKFHYSNIAFEILGHLIELVSEKEFESYIEEYILEPLEMKDSSLLYRDKSCYNIVTPHTKNLKREVVISKVFPYNRAHAPSSTLTSNAIDMSKWGMVNLNKGTFKGISILRENSYKKMWQPIANVKEGQESIGLGWFLAKHREYTMLGHDGRDVGFSTSFGIFLEKGLSVGVFVNIDNISTRRIMRKIFDLLLEKL